MAPIAQAPPILDFSGKLWGSVDMLHFTDTRVSLLRRRWECQSQTSRRRPGMLLAQWLFPNRWPSCAGRSPKRRSQEPQIVLLLATIRERKGSQRWVPEGSCQILQTVNDRPDNTTWNRGYENLGSQILEAGANPDQKEGYYVGEEITKDHPYFLGKKLNSGPNQWPEGFADAELFRRASMEYYTHLHALARDVLSVVAQTLYLDADYFSAFTDGAVATLRYLHYPPQPKDSDEKLSRGIGAHTDFGSVTLLMQDEVDGLQVWEKSTEEWLDVAPIKGAYVVNLGNMMARW
jgi:hypothetical protein